MDSVRNFYRRQKQKAMVRMDKADMTVDEMFSAMATDHENRMRIVTRLNENYAALEGCIRTLTGVMHLIGDDLQLLLDDGSAFRPAVDAWKQSSNDLYERLGNEIADAINAKCLQPVAALLPEAKKVRQDMKERENAQLDYDARRTKVNEIMKKGPAADQVKVQRYRMKESATRDIYNRKNQQLIQALQLLDASTTDACNTSFVDMVLATGQFFERASQQLRTVIAQTQQMGRPQPTRPAVQEKIDQMNANPQSSQNVMTFSDIGSFEQMHLEAPQASPPPQQAPPAAAAAAPAAPFYGQVPVQDPTATVGNEFFYLDDQNNQFGPVTYAGLKEAYRAGAIHDSTLVFGHGMANWQEIGAYAQLKSFLRS
jgi:hypothetical protein